MCGDPKLLKESKVKAVKNEITGLSDGAKKIESLLEWMIYCYTISYTALINKRYGHSKNGMTWETTLFFFIWVGWNKPLLIMLRGLKIS